MAQELARARSGTAPDETVLEAAGSGSRSVLPPARSGRSSRWTACCTAPPPPCVRSSWSAVAAGWFPARSRCLDLGRRSPAGCTSSWQAHPEPPRKQRPVIERQLLQPESPTAGRRWWKIAPLDWRIRRRWHALRAATPSLPGTELLLPRLAAALTPGNPARAFFPEHGAGPTGLAVALTRAGIAGLLLAHPLAQQREQVLDALRDGPDETTLAAICSRMVAPHAGRCIGSHRRSKPARPPGGAGTSAGAS